MPRFLSTALLVLLLLSSSLVYGQAGGPGQAPDASASAQSKTANDHLPATGAPPIPTNAPRMSQQTRYEIIRDFETQLVYARTAFPMGRKGLELKDGVITPNGEELREALAIYGPAIKPGDPAHISFVRIKDDHIHFEINGGPEHRKKWYQRIEVGGGPGGPAVTGPDRNPQANVHGSFVDVYFGKYVPELTPQQLRALLLPVLDFNAQNKEQAYLDTVPPKAKEAILAHHVLVGMNQEMVLHAKGKPPKKVRERDGGIDYEEWIFGEPPADVDFVRIVGDEVVRVETMKVDGQKIVRTEKEIVLPERDRDKEAKKEPAPPAKAPSLRRPGEDAGDVPKPAGGQSPLPPVAPPTMPQPPGGPGELIIATR